MYTFLMFDTYIEAVVQYLLIIYIKNMGLPVARGWRAKHVRYFDISKLRKSDTSNLSIRLQYIETSIF